MVEVLIIGCIGTGSACVHTIAQNIEKEIILVGLEKEPVGIETLREKSLVITRLPDVIISEIVYDLKKEVFIQLKNIFSQIKIAALSSRSLLNLIYKKYRHPP